MIKAFVLYIILATPPHPPMEFKYYFLTPEACARRGAEIERAWTEGGRKSTIYWDCLDTETIELAKWELAK